GRHGLRRDEDDHAGGHPALPRAEPGGSRTGPRAARRGPPRARVTAPAPSRRWHGVWPAHVPPSLPYPRVPAGTLLEQNLPRFGSRIALREIDHETLAERRTLTYEQLWRAVRGAAAGLRGRGVGRGRHVGLCLPNGVALIVGYYAAWHAGGVVVPMNP